MDSAQNTQGMEELGVTLAKDTYESMLTIPSSFAQRLARSVVGAALGVEEEDQVGTVAQELVDILPPIK